ncbi:MAG: hypothetical protein DYG94_07850 [Leptolyngbya sp. PLA3]|nr:MAG: hypothetical protein EDM82_10240 [Cyanobacteria bacterium CYA]MCE7968644.1 hypothetical protein [Leptolyngbya sp. PL-A3]
MEHEIKGIERSAFSRLEAVREADCDALVDLFLGDAQPVRRVDPDLGGPTDQGGSRLELVVAAHLDEPESAFEQFCTSIASRAGQSLGCVRHAGAGWVAWVHGRRLALGDRCASIATAVSDVARRCPRVVVLLPRQDEVGRLVAGLDGLSDPPDAIVVLSTTRESDVVASYRQIKSIAALSPRRLHLVEIGMIADDEVAAQSALTRLRDTSDRFLGEAVSGTIHLPPQVGRPATPAPASDLPDAPDHSMLRNGLSGENHRESSNQASPREDVKPAPVAVAAPAPDARPSGRDLLAMLPGVEPVGLRCPEAPGVAFGVDRQGRLHAVSGGVDGACSPDMERSLMLAEAFVARHAVVLCAVDHRLGNQPEVHLHLVSDRYGVLAPLIGGHVHLHLAIGVDVAGQRHWGASELSV